MEIWSKCDICGRDIPVGELCYGLKKGNCICKNCCTGFENCTFTLAPMPTLTPPNEWISVEDRLPEPGDLIVYADNTVWGYQYGICRVCGKEKAFDYWMPLQDLPNNRPPEGEEDT